MPCAPLAIVHAMPCVVFLALLVVPLAICVVLPLVATVILTAFAGASSALLLFLATKVRHAPRGCSPPAACQCRPPPLRCSIATS